MTDDESYARWWSQRFAGFLRIEKKVVNFNDLLYLRSGNVGQFEYAVPS